MGVNNAPTGLSFEAKTEACDYHFCVSTEKYRHTFCLYNRLSIFRPSRPFLHVPDILFSNMGANTKESPLPIFQKTDSFSRDRC